MFTCSGPVAYLPFYQAGAKEIPAVGVGKWDG